MSSLDDIGNEVAERDAGFHYDNPRQFNVSGSHIRPDGFWAVGGGRGFGSGSQLHERERGRGSRQTIASRLLGKELIL